MNKRDKWQTEKYKKKGGDPRMEQQTISSLKRRLTAAMAALLITALAMTTLGPYGSLCSLRKRFPLKLNPLFLP